VAWRGFALCHFVACLCVRLRFLIFGTWRDGSIFLSFSSSKLLSKHLKLTSWSWALLEKPPVKQLFKNFPTSYRTRKFVNMFRRALHWSLSWDKSIQYIPPHHISLRSILILSTHLHLCISSGIFPSGFPSIPLRSNACCMPCPSPPPWIYHSNYTLWRVKVMKLLIMLFSPISRHFIFFGPNILHSALFSNALSPCSSLNVRGQQRKHIVLCILILMFLYSRREEKRFWTEW
jgi:hypothetical protein